MNTYRVLLADNCYGTNPRLRDITWDDLIKRAEDPPKKRRKGKDAIWGGNVDYTIKTDDYGNDMAVNKTIKDRSLIILDCDHVQAPAGKSAEDYASDMVFDYCNRNSYIRYLLYSSFSASAQDFRFRLIIPLSRPVSPDEYRKIASVIIQDCPLDWDPVSARPTQAMFLPVWPEVCIDDYYDEWDKGYYYYDYADGRDLDPDIVLGRYQRGHYRIIGAGYQTGPRNDYGDRTVKKTGRYTDFEDYPEGDPRNKNSIVGSFCRAYTIEELIEDKENRIPYEQCGSKYKLIGSRSPAGGYIKGDGTLFYTLHATDEYSGRDMNAWDLVLNYRFGGDADRMYEWARKLEIVKNEEYKRHERNQRQ